MLSYIKLILEKLLNDEVHYIGGSISLPPPLSKKEEEELISKLKTDDKNVKPILIERNLRLVVYIAKKFENTPVGVEDLISIGTIGLIKAINTFNPEKNIKLATYASRCIENEILMYLRKVQRTKTEISIDEPINVDGEGNDLSLVDILGSDNDTVYKEVEESDNRKVLRQAIMKLNDREKMIMELRYGFEGKDELTQKEVADKLGISQSYISRIEKKVINRLKKEFFC